MLDKKIDKVNYKVNNLINAIDIKEQNKKSKATEWLKNTSDLLSIIDTYNHRKFSDGKFDKLSTKYELCKSNFEDENYEASIASLQSLWQEAVKLRFELEYLENEWNEYLKNAIESNNNLIATCEAQEIVKIVFDTENEVKELDIDIDFWCNGKLSKLKEEANKQKQVLLDNTQNLELKELIINVLIYSNGKKWIRTSYQNIHLIYCKYFISQVFEISSKMIYSFITNEKSIMKIFSDFHFKTSILFIVFLNIKL